MDPDRLVKTAVAVIAFAACHLGCSRKANEEAVGMRAVAPSRRPTGPPQAGRVYFAPTRDTRTAQQVAAAACNTRCRGTQTQTKEMLASSGAPITPPSWTIADWYIDPSNSIGCASDVNSGTSATCSGGCSGSTCLSGVGPIRTYGELVVHRLGTPSPQIPYGQSVTLHQISAQPSPTVDRWTFSPIMSGGATATVRGTMSASGSGTNGTVVALNTSAQQEWSIDLGQAAAPFVGMVYEDTVVGAWAIVHATSGNVATITQPFSDPTASTQLFSVLPAMVSPATGHAYTIWSPCASNLDVYAPESRQYNAASNFSALFDLLVTAGSGSGYGVGFPFSTIGHSTYIANTVFQTGLLLEPNGLQADYRRQFINCWFPNYINYISDAFVVGGGWPNTAALVNFSGDVLIDGQAYIDLGKVPYADFNAFECNGGSLFLAMTEVGAGVTVQWGAAEDAPVGGVIAPNLYGPGIVWGAGGLALDSGAVVDLAGHSATSMLKQTGGLTVDGVAFAFSTTQAQPAVQNWVALTPASFDAAAGATGFGGSAVGQYGSRMIEGP